ncbi:MAG TPA: hypothetical protein VNT81_23885 [Vicinamibacterales bacterium]|nr:hypothetical protein [Vicinamibacterales bacterium]
MAELTMLCGPVFPPPDAVVTKLCHHLGYRMIGEPAEPADLALYWDWHTWRTPPDDLVALAGRMPIVNLQCRDFSKRRVDAVHQRVFGRSLRVDPQAFAGPFVVKSDENAMHDGRVVYRPITPPDGGFVYQRLIDNRVDDQTVMDIRTPVIGAAIPLVYHLYRPVASRFAVDDTSARIVETADVFSAEEIALLKRFTASMGMDYAELDVLRDREHGQIWVVDANPTPWGPPRTLGATEHRLAVERLSAAFQAFVRTLLAAGPRSTSPA